MVDIGEQDARLRQDSRPGSLPIGFTLGGGLALVLAITARLIPILSADGFPAGDGGLFAVMANDLRDAFPALPAVTTYNQAGIPFAYPPLGSLILAGIPGDPIRNEVVLAALVSLGSVAALFAFARAVLDGFAAAFVATIVFGLLPSAWLVLGGDFVRGLFLVLYLLAMWRTWELVHRPTMRKAGLVGVVVGLALLAHPYAYTVLPVSIAVVWAVRPSLRSARYLLASLVVAALLAIPWVAIVVTTHGWDPYMNALGSHGVAPVLLRIARFGMTGMSGIDVVTPLAIVGFAHAAIRGPWFIPLLFGILLVVPGSEPRTLAIPIALAVGALYAYVASMAAGNRGRAVGVVAVVLAVVVAGGAFATLASSRNYAVTSPSDRAAAAWMRESLDADTRVAIISAEAATSVDEWFPALSGLHSIGTYQGSEWLAPSIWQQRVATSQLLEECVSVECIPAHADVLFVSSDAHATIDGLPAPVYDRGTRVYLLAAPP